MIRMFLASLFTCLHLIAFAQMPERSPADSLYDAGELKAAIERYAADFARYPDSSYVGYNYACALALDGQIDTAFHFLRLATARDTSVRVLTDPDFYALQKDERWTAFEDDMIARVEEKYGEYENLPLVRELWNMKLKDQAFYYHLRVAEKQGGRYNPVSKAIWELKSKLNDANVARLVEIIDEYGWPEKSLVKGTAAQAAFLIIQHADIEVQQKYLPLMRTAADEGEASWSSLALLIDRTNLRTGKPQVYGSQIYRNDDGSYYVKDLEEPQYVNQRRREVGLPPIEDYVKRWNIEWDIEQLEK